MPSINVKVSEDQLEALKSIKAKNGITWRHLLRKATWFLGCTERKPFTKFGKEWQLDPPVRIEKPCHKLGWCPYGKLVEGFPLEMGPRSDTSCQIFGHDCPVFYCSEPLSEVKPQ